MQLKEKLLTLDLVIDNEYLDKYVELIEANRNTKREKFKTQKHHIIPKYYFKLNGLKVDNSSLNIVNLMHKDHILAHYYLCCCSFNQYYYQNAFALNRLIKIGNKSGLFYIEQDKNLLESIQSHLENANKRRSDLIKIQHSKGTLNQGKEWRQKLSESIKDRVFVVNANEELHLIKKEDVVKYLELGYIVGKYYNKNNNPHLGMKRTQETKTKISLKKKGKRHISKNPEETRKKISLATKGKIKDENWRKNLSTSLKGKRHWTNGVIRVVQVECPGEDFYIGEPDRQFVKDRIWVHNKLLKVEKWIKKSEVENYLNNGYVYGRLKE